MSQAVISRKGLVGSSGLGGWEPRSSMGDPIMSLEGLKCHQCLKVYPRGRVIKKGFGGEE